ncbi:MAG: hypothetical protein AB7P02_23985 [Alphaproteobacteria bacterium]
MDENGNAGRVVVTLASPGGRKADDRDWADEAAAAGAAMLRARTAYVEAWVTYYESALGNTLEDEVDTVAIWLEQELKERKQKAEADGAA